MRRNRATIIKTILLVICGFLVFQTSIRLLFEDDSDSNGKLPSYIEKGSERKQVARMFGGQLMWWEIKEDGSPNPQIPNAEEVPEYILKQQKDVNGKIDWHDWDQISEELKRVGPGEQGAGVQTLPSEETEKQKLYAVNGFNAYASDKIPLNRSIRDIRHPECRRQKYLAKLPTVSVVIPFHNEHWTSLLRNVYSILIRSPPHLLREVILADDFSTKDFLKRPLDEHFEDKRFGGKVRVVRAKQREGLIRTRLLGAANSTGDVIIFLDSHCEVNVNWLAPLVEPIAIDYRTVTCPFIDVLDFDTFEYRPQDEGARGAFDWEFFYKRLPLTRDDLDHPARPFKSPVMAGGLFAISRRFFYEIGSYDPELQIWGGEQYELSFKIWQCHGQMVDTPCSRVGHVYRKFAPFPNNAKGDFVGRNYKRVAEVWMDEYKEFLYKRRPQYRDLDAGDLSERISIRNKLQCKPFSWFMKEVAFDLESYYPTVEPSPYAKGEIRSVGAPSLCIDSKFKGEQETFGLDRCIKDDKTVNGEQNFELSWHKDLRPIPGRHFCFDVSVSYQRSPILLYHCHGMQGNQLFKYNVDTQQLYHPVSNNCIDCDPARKEVFMNPCDQHSATQRWKFESFNSTLVKQLWLWKVV